LPPRPLALLSPATEDGAQDEELTLSGETEEFNSGFLGSMEVSAFSELVESLVLSVKAGKKNQNSTRAH
jgi:hypothetical protein